LDFDLEAPGLHYKFALGPEDKLDAIDQGVVDLIYTFCTTGKMPDSLSRFAIQLGEPDSTAGRIWLMPAGKVPTAEYWRRLARISWHEMFYSESAPGIPLFLELKQRIEDEFDPDFLLIDSRTGITEVGGVATTVLPDKVVCLAMKNRENLEGAREVLRSIKRAPRLPTQNAIQILPVLTRIPELGPEKEEAIVKQVKEFLNEEAFDLSSTLNVDVVFILHSESDLEVTEAIRVGGTKSADQSPLLRDYLRLFTRLISREVVDPYIAPLIQEALIKGYDDPAGAERDLRAIADYSGHAQAYRALLKFYRMRRAGTKALKVAEQLWDLSGHSNDPLVWEIVQRYFPPASKGHREDWQQGQKDPPFNQDFVEAIWMAAGSNDEQVGLELARSFENSKGQHRAAAILRKLLPNASSGEIAVKIITLLLELPDLPSAQAAFESLKEQLKSTPAFQTIWGQVVLASKDKTKIQKLLENPDFDSRALATDDFAVLAELLSVGGREPELLKVLNARLDQVPPRGSISEAVELGKLFYRYGFKEEFNDSIKRAWQKEPHRIDQLLERVVRR
jgi:hypothetical protein